MVEIVKSKVETLSRIIVLCQEIFLYTEYFHKPNDSKELELYSNAIYYQVYGKHLRFIGHLLYRNLILEVHKLYSDSTNDEFRIKLILNLLGKLPEEYKIDHEQIRTFKNRIKIEKSITDKVKILRNKIYAHTDPLDIENLNLEVDFKEIENLIQIGKDLIKYLYPILFNLDFLFYPIQFDRERFILLSVLQKGAELRDREIVESYGFEYKKK